MERRSFVKKTVLTGVVAAIMPSLSNAMEPKDESLQSGVKGTGAEFYELKVYTLKSNAQQKIVEDFYKSAIVTYNRFGVKAVGVFTELAPVDQTKLYVLLPYQGMDHYLEVNDKLEKDAAFNQQSEEYLNAPAATPAYERIESSLLKAFAHSPKMVVPKKETRIFELRQYQSPSEAAGKKKIEMFNDQGEIDIFKRLNFNPVFWGETLIGPLRPNLTYMVSFSDLASKDAHWKSFGSDPQWKKISSVPDYADALLVNKIISVMLKPTDYSQV
jgi:hypothetical protein